MNASPTLLASLSLAALLTACGHHDDGHGHDHGADEDHAHGNEADPGNGGTAHAGDHDGDHDGAHDEGHEHAEESLGSVRIGDIEVELAQGHGAVAPGGEAHLVVKLPYSDSGATIVRAWVGSDDRTLSFVGRGEYAATHDDYDIHATAPDPLPENAMWWVELERPDGTKLLGSARAILE